MKMSTLLKTAVCYSSHTAKLEIRRVVRRRILWSILNLEDDDDPLESRQIKINQTLYILKLFLLHLKHQTSNT